MPKEFNAGTFALDGLTVINRMGFGAMRLTGMGIWGEPKDPEEARAVLKRAVEIGVNFIDTADSYGPQGLGTPDRRSALPLPRRSGRRYEGGLRSPGDG